MKRFTVTAVALGLVAWMTAGTASAHDVPAQMAVYPSSMGHALAQHAIGHGGVQQGVVHQVAHRYPPRHMGRPISPWERERMYRQMDRRMYRHHMMLPPHPRSIRYMHPVVPHRGMGVHGGNFSIWIGR
jgi:hypothetical protein